MSEPSFIYKVCVIGPGGAGKTSAVKRYSDGTFDEQYQVTVGVQHSSQTIEIHGDEGPTTVKVIVWDLGGQDKFRFIRPMFYRSARGLVLMFDITDRSSFESLPRWVKEAEDSLGRRVPMVLVANKTDLPNHQVSNEEIEDFAASIGAECVFTSVKTGENVENVFEKLGRAVYEEASISEQKTTPSMSAVLCRN